MKARGYQLGEGMFYPAQKPVFRGSRRIFHVETIQYGEAPLGADF